MEQIKTDVESFARIRVVGVGGSGGNAVNHMMTEKVKGVEFIAINSDAQDLHHSLAKKKIHVGKNLTRGLGAGGNPDMGRRAAEETREEIQDVIKGADMVFIAGGMGGGTGTGAAPVVASVAKNEGILTIGVVTKPFFFEGASRMKLAERGLEELEKEVEALRRALKSHGEIIEQNAKLRLENQADFLCFGGDKPSEIRKQGY